MSQSVTIQTAGVFADSTVLKAYPKNQIPDNRRAPIGASTAEGTTSSGAVTIAGLEDGQAYLVGAEVESKWRYIQVIAPRPASRTGSGKTAVASANPMTVPTGSSLIEVTGTTEIKKITPGPEGQIVVLKFASTPTVKDGENLKLSADLVATADDTLALISDGTNWYEFGRAVN